MLLIDTNVLAYDAGGEHPLKAPCREILAMVMSGRLVATTTPEVIQEFAHISARKRLRNEAAAAAVRYAVLLAPLRPTEVHHLEAGLALWRQHAGLGCFDAVLAAVALDFKDATVVSADSAFAAVPGLRHVYPNADGVARLLA